MKKSSDLLEICGENLEICGGGLSNECTMTCFVKGLLERTFGSNPETDKRPEDNSPEDLSFTSQNEEKDIQIFLETNKFPELKEFLKDLCKTSIFCRQKFKGLKDEFQEIAFKFFRGLIREDIINEMMQTSSEKFWLQYNHFIEQSDRNDDKTKPIISLCLKELLNSILDGRRVNTEGYEYAYFEYWEKGSKMIAPFTKHSYRKQEGPSMLAKRTPESTPEGTPESTPESTTESTHKRTPKSTPKPKKETAAQQIFTIGGGVTKNWFGLLSQDSNLNLWKAILKWLKDYSNIKESYNKKIDSMVNLLLSAEGEESDEELAKKVLKKFENQGKFKRPLSSVQLKMYAHWTIERLKKLSKPYEQMNKLFMDHIP